MRLLSAVLAVFLSLPLSAAGVVYRFESSTTGVTNSSFSGTVKADGESIRVDVSNGDGAMFKDDAVIVSRDGGKTLAVADLGARTWYELKLDQMLSGGMLKDMAGMLDIKVSSAKVSSRDLGPAGKLEGFDTRRTLLETSHDLSINALGQKLMLRVSTRSETWSTAQISGDFAAFLQMRGARTGIEAIDSILASQKTSVTGFPLRQILTIKVSQNGTDTTSTTTINVREPVKRVIDPATFVLPAGLKRVKGPV